MRRINDQFTIFNIPTRVEWCYYYDKCISLNQPLFQYIKRPQTDSIIYVHTIIIRTSDILFTLSIIVCTMHTITARLYLYASISERKIYNKIYNILKRYFNRRIY